MLMIDGTDHHGNRQLTRAPVRHASDMPVRSSRGTVAFVLCGGGSRGVMEVGFIRP